MDYRLARLCYLVPDTVFATSPEEEQGGDDWTVVQVQGIPAPGGAHFP